MSTGNNENKQEWAVVWTKDSGETVVAAGSDNIDVFVLPTWDLVYREYGEVVAEISDFENVADQLLAYAERGDPTRQLAYEAEDWLELAAELRIKLQSDQDDEADAGTFDLEAIRENLLGLEALYARNANGLNQDRIDEQRKLLKRAEASCAAGG